jgi:hypothetical protein
LLLRAAGGHGGDAARRGDPRGYRRRREKKEKVETKTLKNFVNGEYAAADGPRFDIVNPATGEAFATSPASGQADVDRAFGAAEKAFETWRDSTPSERQLALLRLADKIEGNAEELVRASPRTPANPWGSRPKKRSRRWWTRSAFSPARRASSKVSRPASTWPA